MKKIVKESLNEGSADFYKGRPFGNTVGQEAVDRENRAKAKKFNKREFWTEVAELMDGELDDFELNDYGRSISIRMSDGDILDIEQSWRNDGSPVKPVVKINRHDFGRIPIWDAPEDVAEDYLEIYNEYIK